MTKTCSKCKIEKPLEEFHRYIIPQCKYDFLDLNEIKKCWSLRNLRPLKKEDNSSKNGKLIPELIKHYQIKDLLPKGILQDT